MPRNSSGTYTLPSGNPVVSGTLIEASWANTTLSDLASAMTDSLSRDGEGGMTAPLRLYDGDVSLPGLAFSNETSTGLYRAGAGDMRLAVTGSQVMQFLTTGVAVTGTLSATGAVSFTGQTATLENATAYYPQLINRNKTNDANGSYISLQKIRSSSIVQNGDVLGNVIFAGYDGAAYLQGAFINAVISATPGTNDMPTDLVFGTTADGGSGPTERLRISNTGAGTATNDWTFYGVKVGRGAGAVSTNTAVGASALAANTSGAENAATGYLALAANTSGTYNTAFGSRTLSANTTASNNTALGYGSMNVNTTGANNTAVGYFALINNTTASNNTAVGYQSAYSNTTSGLNTAVGYQALYSNTTGDGQNTATGYQALYASTGSELAAFGTQALGANTTGNKNTAFGAQSLRNNTTASYNTAVGYQAGYSSTTAEYNTFIGYYAGRSTTGDQNTFIGKFAGNAVTTGTLNTIIGAYNGNQGGLDIRTASNYIVLSDGGGTPQIYVQPSGNTVFTRTTYSSITAIGCYQDTSASAANVFITSGGSFVRSTSSRKYKTDIQDATHGLAELLTLRSVTYKGTGNHDGQQVLGGLIAEEVHEAGLTEFVQYAEDGTPDALAYGHMVSLCVKAIQELKAEFDAYKEAHP